LLNESLYSSEKMDWGTPQKLFDRLNHYFGFTLDPCSSEENKKCNKNYTIENDGLLKDWSKDIVFMNPPYGRIMKDWIKKAYEESLKGATVVCLVPSRTDVKWFHDYAYGKADIVFLNKRLEFEGSNNKAPFPSMLIIYNSNREIDIDYLKKV
jgi:phage N-6-adenine-methyltransferase